MSDVSDDIPDIIISELKYSFKDMKYNKSPGDDAVTVEHIEIRGTILSKLLYRLFNAYLRNCTTPAEWKKAIVVKIHEKWT